MTRGRHNNTSYITLDHPGEHLPVRQVRNGCSDAFALLNEQLPHITVAMRA
jgi:hypothetical protein